MVDDIPKSQHYERAYCLSLGLKTEKQGSPALAKYHMLGLFYIKGCLDDRYPKTNNNNFFFVYIVFRSSKHNIFKTQ